MPPDSSASPTNTGRPSRGTLALLALIVALGLAVRLHGIGFLLPQLGEPDGLVIDYQLRALEGHGRESASDPLNAYYPHLVARTAALVPRSWVAPATPHTLAEHLRVASASRMRARIAVALLSLLAIPLTWWLARHFVPDAWALMAAALVAGSPFLVWFAQQARPHAAATSFALLAVCAAVHLRQAGGWRAYAVAGLAAGLAVGVLQSGLAVLPAIALAILLRVRADRWRALAGTALVLAIAAAFVFFLYPFMFTGGPDPESVTMRPDGTLAVSRHLVFVDLFNGRGFAVVWRAFREYDPLLTWLALFGFATVVVVSPRWAPRCVPAFACARTLDLAIVLAHAVPYLIAIGLYQRTYQRFALPLVPYLGIVSAYGAWQLWRLAARGGRGLSLVAGALACAAAAAELAWSWQLGRVRARPDTIQEAATWITQHVPPETQAISVMPGLDLPIARSRASIKKDWHHKDEQSVPWFRYQAELMPGAIEGPAWHIDSMPLITSEERTKAHSEAYAFARELPGGYAVIIAWPKNFRPALNAVREGLRGQFELAARFAPDDPDPGTDIPLAHQDDEYPFRVPWAQRMLAARCVGPVVEIYRLR